MKTLDLGILGYRDAWRRQEAVHADVADGGAEYLLLVEHPPTITLGRRAADSRSHVAATAGELHRMGVEVVESDRGGDVTYHGPGQLVCYPIVRLADRRLSVGGYMRLLQEAARLALDDLRVPAFLDPDAPGVWCRDPLPDGVPAKLCAVGVRVRRGVTLHGLALNVEPDLRHFKLIDACGLGRPTTSLRRLLRERSPSMVAVKAVLGRRLRERLCAGAAEMAEEDKA